MNIYNILIVFIILIVFTLIYLLFNIVNKKIEPFEDVIINNIPLPNITDDNLITISSLALQTSSSSSTSNSSTDPNLLLNTSETLEIKDARNYYQLTSSYKVSSGQYISSLFKLNPPSVLLMSDILYKNDSKNIKNGFPESIGFYNYINIVLPYSNIIGTKIEISYSNFELQPLNNFRSEDRPSNKDVRIYTSDDDNEFVFINKKDISQNTNTTLVFDIPSGKIINSILYILVSPLIKNITLTKMRIFVKETVYIQDTTIKKDIIRFGTDNPSEVVEIPNTYVIPEARDTELGIGSSVSKLEQLNRLFKFITPWAIYNGGDYSESTKTIPELLNRQCLAAKISGELPIIQTDNNIKYLSGTTETIVEFPQYSLPEFYTICAITKYTNNTQDVSKRGRILTSTTSGTNWLLGHHAGVTGVMHNGEWKTTSSESYPTNNTDWVVSCVKSSISANNTILINGVSRGIKGPDKIYNYLSGKRLTINIDNYNQNSDFGLSYLIIWNAILSDNQLRLVSESLQDYLNTGKNLDLIGININLNDGSTREKAARSAMEIKRLTCTNRNGLYWILPGYGDKSNAKQVYCIMDDMVFGGGWMLALKGAKNSGAFVYSSEHWTNYTRFNDEPSNKSDYESYKTDAKYDIYNYYRAIDCLAMFDVNDTNGEATFVNNPEYGWIWKWDNIYNGDRISLLEFFVNNYSKYYYTSHNPNKGFLEKWMSDRGFNANYLTPQYFDSFLVNVTCKSRVPLNRKIFSQQEQFKAWGLNVIPQGWSHAVRWGGSFNENYAHQSDGIPNSNDVSCGIGLQARTFSAGDAINCCQSTTGTNSSMGFKWFIR